MLDRSESLDFKEIHLPKFIQPKIICLSNGLEVYFMEGGTQDLCRLDLVFHAGTKNQTKPLVAAICNAMLFEGTNKKNGTEIHESIDFYGAYTQLDVNADRSFVSLYTMNTYFDKVVPIFIDAIKNAIFPESEFKILLEQRKQSHHINSEKVEFEARRIFFNTLFDNHPYGKSASLDDYDVISRQDLLDFHEQFYKSADLKIYISGLLPSNSQFILEEYLGTWKLKKSPIYEQYQPSINNSKKYINRFGALQSAIRIGRVCFNSRHDDYHKFKFLSVVLGGYFGSRLMSNIREEKGLTYGIGAICIHQEESGYFCISTQVKAEGTKVALKEIYKELRRLREMLIPDEELDLVKNYIKGQILKSSDGPFAQCNLLKNMHIQNVGFEFYDTYFELLNNLNANELRDLANQYLKEEDLCEIVVGNTSI